MSGPGVARMTTLGDPDCWRMRGLEVRRESYERKLVTP
jgi:hypothetical protein